MSSNDRGALEGIAIVGMAGRFPRARDLAELWRNLRDGVDCISDFADGELEVPVPPEVLADPRYVKARGVLDDVELFDAAFFDIPPRQAELMDPQNRLFLEAAWQALEDAGYDPQRYPGSIGVFGGVTLSSYFLHHIQPHPELLQAVGGYQIALGTDRDYLTTLVSYKLGLRGPSVDVQTACSTSLVATVLACQSLLGYHCDMALAGGVSIKVPQRTGYLYHPGGLDSSDGRCRAFDARADGSVYGSGVGVVVLKRLEDALADGDAVHAVILGGAMNNDGASRVGFTAPGVEGQAEVIANAQALAGVDPETIGYVECHGTGTALGDPIEVAALTRAFRAGGARRRGFCAIGSVKTNIGHCSAAAGVAGLIKAALALKNRQVPPSLHFERPNPGIDFAASPFRVSDQLADWEADDHPRRAGVSSFGLGGTNAHVILEEAPAPEPSGPSRPWQLLVLSARSEAALEAATDDLAADLAAHPDRPLADVAFTAQVGRRAFSHRRALVCRDTEDARQALATRDPRRLLDAVREPHDSERRPVAFLFSGVGDHYPGMARGLYDSEPVFREHLDRCCELMSARLGGDLRTVIFEEAGEADGTGPDLKRLLGRGAREERKLERTLWAQPAVFAVEVALARLWMSWGVRPDALLGYSLGEYTAACLAGVLPLEDAALLVAERARLLEGLPAGAMLAIPLPESEIAPRLAAAGLDLAAVNTPGVCVAAGPPEAMQELRDRLAEEGVPCRLLPVGHAFHSRWMEPVAPALTRLARGLRLAPPKIPYVSDVTGTWITPAEATDPEYWARHLCRPVRFAAGLAALWQDPARVLLEVGPGFGLSTLALQTAEGERLAVPSLRNEHDPQPDPAFLLTALGKLWLAGVGLDWEAFWKGERRRRVRLPGYPFERARFWIEPGRPRHANRPETVDEEAARLLARLRELEALGAKVAVPGPTGPISGEPPRPALAARHARPRLRNAYVPPESAAEIQIAGIFEALLGIQGVGAHDSFFEMGGHSLLATQVLARLRDRFGVELELAALFEEPTAAGLARRVEAAGVKGEGRPVPVPRGGDLPLSYAQQRLWFLDRLMPGNPFYNLASGVRLSGPLDVAALREALAALVRRHETLRTGFPEVEARPVQRIAASIEIALPVIELSGLPPALRTERLAALAAETARRPFDLARPPLLRAALLRLEHGEHALLFAIHHIIADAWSLGVLTREIAALYSGLPLPPLPVQYADFAVWQRGWLTGEVLERQLGYWRERLAGAPATELPTDRPRPAVQSFRGATRRVAYPAALAAAVAGLAQRSGASPFMVLLAGFNALLARWTGQDDLVVGTPIANRRLSEVEGLIGLFVNTLVLRTDAGGDPSGLALIERVKEAALGAYAHQDLPFEQLVEELHPRRDLSRNPLFQVMFNLLNTPIGRIAAGDGRLTLSPLPAAGGASLFDLQAYVTLGEQGVAIAWEHATDLFEEPTIERLSRAFEMVLEGLTGRPETRLADLPLLGAAERHQLTVEWNDTGIELPREATVHALFAAQAARTPEAVALVAGGESFTYAELAARVDRLARRLRRRGVRPGVLVAVSLERSAEMVAALLAVLAAGGAYVPLDPAHPEERRRWVLEDSGAALVLADPLEPVDDDGPPIPPLAGPGDLAHVIYTSGSTGRPKGVAVSHGALVNFLVSVAREPGLGPDDRLLAITTISFDIAGLELFLPLAVGARIVLASRDDAMDGARLAARLREERISVLQGTPPTWRLLLTAGWQGTPGLKAFCCGEALPPDLAAALLPRVGELWNLYGPTETTIWSTVQRIEAGKPVTIGRPLANTGIQLLDRGLRPVPLGVAGELCIGGAGLARGYHGRPDLTAERFVPAPSGARLYRTGDLARFLPDGRIDFLGRLDHQVKIRGFRVEPGEIEAALRETSGVREAVVLLREDAPGDPRLAAYVVGEEIAESTLRDALRQRLPAYMVPAAFVRLDALPLTSSGKVDRKALPAPEGDRTATVSEPPRTAAEKALAGIWQSVLRVTAVGVQDDFFDLGGHSLLAAQVAARIRETFGVELPLAALFQAATLAALAARLETAEGAAGPPLIPVAWEPGAPVPLSFAQERLWFLDRLDGASPVYNLPTALRLSGPLNVPALAGALTEIARRHATLRTTFAEWEGKPVQVIAPPGPFPLPVVDLSGLSRPRALPWAKEARAFGTTAPLETRSAFSGALSGPAGRDSLAQGNALGWDGGDAELRRLAIEEALRPFDLQRGPVLRATLLRLGEAEHAVLFTLHHIAGDAWSLGVLTQEVAALYTAFAAGRPSPLPELPLQYADYAFWQREWLQGEALERRLAFWRETLAGAATLQLPADRPRPPVQTFRGAAHSVALPAVSRRGGATLFMTLLADLAALLHRWADQDDVVVGTPVAGRSRVQLEPLIGFFVNTVVLRADCAGDPTLAALLERVRAASVAAFSHQEIPFEKVVEELQPERDLSRTPLFQVLFTLQNTPAEAVELPGLTLAPLATGGEPPARFDLTIAATETPDGLFARFDYNVDLFEAATVARLAEQWARVMTGGPDLRLSEIPLLSEEETAQLLREGSGGAPLTQGERVWDLFAAQAARTPEAAALIFEGETLSYRELLAWSHRLARRLRGLGVGPEVRVGLALERSPEVLAAMLAVLAAGGAYVPLDPGYPAERLAFMVEDARLSVVLNREDLSREGCEGSEDAGPPEPLPGSGPDSPVYVIYTSGSTGTPKGVAVRDGGLANFSRAMVEALDLGPGERFLQFASLSFDASAVQIFPTLLSGAALVLHPDPTKLSVAELVALCEREGVTVLDLPAALWRQWVDGLAAAPPSTLHTFLTGGESLSRSTLERWAGLLDRPARFFSSYGPTEATITTALFDLDREDVARFVAAAPSVGSPIGCPLPGVQVLLLDRHLRPVPVGVPGELAIGGAGLARGYLDRPDLTAERFVPDPLAVEAGARLYRTGDLARWRHDGTLEFLGRADGQVKIRGFRVELGEVEAALARHPAVREAVSLVWGADRRLAGYVVPVAEGAVTGPELRAWLRERVPEALVPSSIAVLDAFPTTPGGKVDRRALPPPEADEEDSAVARSPRNPIEETLATVWARLLGVERVGIDRSFFDLGGHSLLATQLISRVREVLGVEVPLRDLFAAPTVAGFALRVEAAMRERAGAGAPPLAPVPRDRELPLSFAQERLWFIDQLQPGNAVYNMPAAIRLHGPLDLAALAGALSALTARHEVLRTSFPATSGHPRQEIAPLTPFPLPVVDLSNLPDPESAAALLTAAEARRPFDLAQGPLLRAGVVRLAADDHLLLATMHHSVSDGWSMGIFNAELAALYRGLTEERALPVLPPLPVQYADYAAWQREWLTGDVLETQLAWWRRELGGDLPVLELPADRPRPALAAFRGGRRSVHVPGAVAAGLAALARGEEATLFMVLLAAFQVLLHRLSGQDDLTVGSPIAGRNRAELEPLIGFFVNTLVLRAGLGDDPAFRALVGRTRATALDAYAHQDIPFEKLVEEVAPRRSLAHTPLFQVMFGLQNLPGGAVEMAQGLTLQALQATATGNSRFDLTLLLADTPAGLTGHLEYDTDLFDPVTVQRWMEHWQVLLASIATIAAGPEARVSELPLLSAAERSQLALEWNDTGGGTIAEGKPATLHGLFLAQAQKRPEAVALIAPEGALTYAELARKAEELAAVLIERGLRPGGRVAVLLERSADAVAGLLAILMAGGTYVPLDPGNPAERLAFQIEDSEAALLLRRGEGLREVEVEISAGGEMVTGSEGLAYIIYTSGSTGTPKGVMIEHRQAVNTLLDINRRFAVRAEDRVFAVSALSFDLSVWDLFGIFAAGGAAVLPAPAAQPDPVAWSAAMARGGVTVWNSAPPLLELLVESGAPLPSTLRLAMLSGDWIPVSLPDRVRRRVPGARIVSLGGATEGSIWSILYPIGTVPSSWRSIPYGRPMAGQRFHVLDRRGLPVPIGVSGELCIGGAGVAVGYLGRPELTAERFVPDPFGGVGARLYRTGDLGRHRADGTLELLGRMDHQVKIRGFRIELGEIETVLAQHPGVREAVAVVREDGGERRLVAYAVPKTSPEAGQDLDPAALRAWLAARLPDPMVPPHIVPLERLPLTANGKVDRRSLPAPEAPAREVVPPRDAVEERLTELWRRFLNLPEVSIHDNFFELGGHSLLATRLVAAVREEMEIEIPVREVFEHPVLADLALAVAGRQAADLDEDELSRMFQDLEGLSDEEVERLLAGEAKE